MLRRHVFAFIALIGTLAFAAPSPFDGKWEMDKKKSPGAKFAPEQLEQEISQHGNKLVINSKYREPKSGMYPIMWLGIMTYELELTNDGSESTRQIGPYSYRSKTNTDGNKMTTDWTAAIEGGQVNGQWIRTLSSDGKEMTLQILTKSSDGRSMDQTLVFHRK